MNFVIHKHVCRSWSIEKDGAIVDRCGWDEMIGEVAHLLINGKGRFFENPRATSSELYASIMALRVTMRPDEQYRGLVLVRRGNRFVDRLTPEEGLAFIAQYTLIERPMFHGLQTYEEWAQCWKWRREQKIAGLITYQPELVA